MPIILFGALCSNYEFIHLPTTFPRNLTNVNKKTGFVTLCGKRLKSTDKFGLYGVYSEICFIIYNRLTFLHARVLKMARNLKKTIAFAMTIIEWKSYAKTTNHWSFNQILSLVTVTNLARAMTIVLVMTSRAIRIKTGSIFRPIATSHD